MRLIFAVSLVFLSQSTEANQFGFSKLPRQADLQNSSDLRNEMKGMISKLRPPPSKAPIISTGDCDTLETATQICFEGLADMLNATVDNFPEKIIAFVDIISTNLKKKDANFLDKALQNTCKLTDQMVKCLRDGQKTCSSQANVVNVLKENLAKNPLKFITELACDEEKVNSKKLSVIKESNLDTCTASDGPDKTVADFLDNKKVEIEKAQEQVDETKLNDYLKSASSVSEKDAKDLERACRKIKDSKNALKTLIEEKSKDLKCNEAAQKMMFQDLTLVQIPGIDQLCELPEPMNSGLQSQGNPKDKKRQTLVLFGLGHMKALIDKISGSKMFITCGDITLTQAVLLSHSKFKIEAELDNSEVSGTVFIKSLTVKMMSDSKSAQLTLGPVVTDFKGTFDDGSDTFEGAKIELLKGKTLKIMDKGSGSFLMIMKYNINATKPMFGVVFRGSESILNETSGILTYGCDKSIDTQTPVVQRRLKREAKSKDEAGEFDKQNTGDDNADSLAFSTSDSMTLSEDADSEMTSSGSMNRNWTFYFFLIMWTMIYSSQL